MTLTEYRQLLALLQRARVDYRADGVFYGDLALASTEVARRIAVMETQQAQLSLFEGAH